jgi:iron complex outermembrane receptor protein
MTKFPLKYFAAVLAALPLAAISQETKTLSVINVSAPKSNPLGASHTNETSLAPQRAATSDSARLLQDIPGVSLYGAGGISSLPAIHGLADDRLRIQVDGMDLMAACPNHMNSALSYIDPTKVGSVTVYAGITPVSVGGDSIGGTIQVKSAAPEFADADAPAFAKAQAGTFFRSNANARGYNMGATWVGHDVNLSFSQSNSQADNYTAARDFKAAARGREGGPLIPGNVVGSSAYSAARNQDIGLALRHEGHLLELSAGEQTVGFEGFPNQRMDMTANKNTLLNLRYTGRYQWGELQARLYDQDTQHKMDMGPDRFSYGYGMPMDTKAKTRGASTQGNIVSSERDIFRLGAEYQE